MPPEPGTPENENPDLSAQKEQRAWDAIVADLSGTIDIGDLTPTPDPFIDELLAEQLLHFGGGDGSAGRLLQLCG